MTVTWSQVVWSRAVVSSIASQQHQEAGNKTDNHRLTE